MRVNAVAPGPIQTGWMADELIDEVELAIPLGRVGTPEDIADACVFLASRQASWITGQDLQVAGGHALGGCAECPMCGDVVEFRFGSQTSLFGEWLSATTRVVRARDVGRSATRATVDACRPAFPIATSVTAAAKYCMPSKLVKRTK